MMTMKDSIKKPRIWLLVAGAALIAFASWSSPNAAYVAGLMQGQSRGANVNTSAGSAESLASGAWLMLRDGWQVQTSSGQPDGAVISKTGFAASGWFPTAVPATVSGVLAHAGVYPDPFFGSNLRDWPGMGRGGRGSAGSGAPQGNPFAVGWWFRTEFGLPAEMAGRAISLHFEGINYRADVWLMASGSPKPIRWLEPCAVSPSTSARPHGQARKTRSRC
jgi:hypothetical protein